MNISVALFFMDDEEEVQNVPRRHLRDASNLFEVPNNQFVANFRVSKEVFRALLDMMEEKWVAGCRTTQIRPDLKLGTFLRFLATGSYQQNLGNEALTSTAKSTVSRTIAECQQIFEDHICGQWIKKPTLTEERNTMEAFYERTMFPGIVGCVDGTHIRIKSPGDELKALYYIRKGYYSINAMVICDHKMRITFVDARHPGSNHDAFVWERSDPDKCMQREFDNGKRNFWILGDGGYKLKPFLMTPYRSPRDVAEKKFNKRHASAHNVIERCFGVLKNRFRCIIGSRGLHYDAAKVVQIINACCALHNMCIHYRSEEPPGDVIDDDLEDEVDDNNDLESRADAIRRKIAINL
ncbi:putative nuclease HARBI1 [Musca vetustissima]|uniref:putative nuclease HARBI1 n=1 Tax=Musca vetustissima TaxID=27455 RepID=UPI002AB76E8F|nr:putative nuclease HARBI1 [Musca vetustissima]